MVAAWGYLAGALIGLWFTVQAWRPVQLPRLLAIPSFFAGWLTNELVLHHYAWQLVMTGVFVRFGALGHPAGWIALAVTLLQWTLMVPLVRGAFASEAVVEAALVDALGPGYRSELPSPQQGPGWDKPRWLPVVLPFRQVHRDVRVEHDVLYGRAGARDLKLDIFRRRGALPGPCPVIVYVHGGAWVLGFRDRQGIPLLTEMALHGWIGVRPAYRLSPAATFPDHLVDVKRAIAWVREHADELGVDPSFVAVSGGSAGGHLASLSALTSDRRDLQPGFEDADTTVQACVPIYGVYDPGDRLGRKSDDILRFFSQTVMKADREEDRKRWRLASPLELSVEATAAPPFLVVHGALDSLAAPQEARAFVANLREASPAPVGHVELPRAQHAFDVFPSIRTTHVIRGVARFLAVVHARRSGQAAAGTATEREERA